MANCKYLKRKYVIENELVGAYALNNYVLFFI